MPSKAEVDAIHIAAATVHGMDYLLTWNYKHIVNAQIQGKLAARNPRRVLSSALLHPTHFGDVSGNQGKLSNTSLERRAKYLSEKFKVI